jgi:hypothetical protein
MSNENKLGQKEFLLKITKECYNQGDYYFAYQTKKGDWIFGYTNDYPMQHGDGIRIRLPDSMVMTIMQHYID